MPYASDAQRGYMHVHHPEIAKKWDAEYPDQEGLPEHVGDKPKKKKTEENHKVASLNEKVIETLQITALALEKAEQERSEKQASVNTYSAKIPAVVDECVKFSRIDDTPEERQKLAEWVSTPEGALDCIMKLASHQVQQPGNVPSLGTSSDAQGRPTGREKKASMSGGGYLGRRTSEKAESWKRFDEYLGTSGN